MLTDSISLLLSDLEPEQAHRSKSDDSVKSDFILNLLINKDKKLAHTVILFIQKLKLFYLYVSE